MKKIAAAALATLLTGCATPCPPAATSETPANGEAGGLFARFPPRGLPEGKRNHVCEYRPSTGQWHCRPVDEQNCEAQCVTGYETLPGIGRVCVIKPGNL